MAARDRQCAKCSKKIPTVGVKTGLASPAAVRFRKGQYAGRWLCTACGEPEKAKGQIVETIYVADKKGQDLGALPAPAAGPAETAEPLPRADAQA